MSTRSLISDTDIKRHRWVYWSILVGLIVVFTAIFFFPFYWMVTGAMKETRELAQPIPTFIPETFQPENFLKAWNRLHIGKYFLNTLYYAVGGWLLQLIFDVGVAYALSKLRPIFGKFILGMILSSLMLPAAALLVPTYLAVVDVPIFGVNLLNTPWALWLPGIANAFNIYVLKRFFDQIPNELLDAAAIDGAGNLRILWSIVMPLSKPVLAVVSIFAIIGMWKDFLFPLLVLQDTDVQTLSVALSRMATTGRVELNELMAGLTIASVPMVVAFLVFQRSILRGLTAGSVKG